MAPTGGDRFTITGNTFHGPTAIGLPGGVVHQSQHVSPAIAVANQIDEVRRLIAAEPAVVDDRAAAGNDLAGIERELARPHTDPLVLDTMLRRLAGRAVAGTALIEAVLTLADMIGRYLG